MCVSLLENVERLVKLDLRINIKIYIKLFRLTYMYRYILKVTGKGLPN